jgi:hypothetical protein
MPGFADVTVPYWRWTDPFPSHLDDTAADDDFLGSENAGHLFALKVCSAPAAKVGNLCANDAACGVGGMCDQPWIRPRFGRCTAGVVGESCVADADCDTAPGNGVCTPIAAAAVGTITDVDVDNSLIVTPYDAKAGTCTAPPASVGIPCTDNASCGTGGVCGPPATWIHTLPTLGFRPHWESLHNRMHVWVAGELLNPQVAAKDPVFWLAHAFFDCMWDAWEGQHDPDYRPDKANFPADAPTPTGEDADDVMRPWNDKKIRDVLSVQALGYKYDIIHAVPAHSGSGLLALTASLLLLGGGALFVAGRRGPSRGRRAPSPAPGETGAPEA